VALPAHLSREPSWQTATSIVRRLQENGFNALFAGGCVRDALRGRASKDIDIATSATPAEMQRLFQKTIPVGVQFGVVRVLQNGSEFELATFRSDGQYLDGRRPVAVRFATPEEDAQRRDFTVNGMFYDPVDDRILDFVGGQADLEQGIIRAIGVAEKRLQEDRLRLLRAIRFAVSLDFEIDPLTWKAVQTHAPEIAQVSPERIREELVKTFANPNRVRALDLLEASGLLQIILPEVSALKGCEQPAEFHPEGDVFVHTRKMLGLLPADASPILVLAVLLHDIGKPPTQSFNAQDNRIRFNGHDRVGAEMTENVLTRLRFSRAEIDAVVEAVRNHMVFKDVLQMRPSRLRRFMARDTFPLELELHRIDCVSSHGSVENYDFLKQKAAELATEPLIPPRLLTGQDLIALGLKPGPAFGRILEAVQTAQLENEITTREEALELAKEMI
jgi:tRNA nucleotidyltransferase/poly(A) polymerase